MDPGGTSGVAIKFANGLWSTLAVPLESQFDVTEKIAAYARHESKTMTVAVEFFSSMQYLSRHGLNTIELVGGIMHVCRVFGVTVFRHAPMHRTPFQSTAHDMLTARRTDTGIPFVIHEEDALAHLLRLEHNLATGAKK